LSGVQGEGAFFALQGAEVSTGGAGDLGGEGLSPLLEEGGAGALGEAGGSGGGQIFHGLEIDRSVGSSLAEGAAGDNVAPLGREVADFLHLLGRESAACHGESCLVLGKNGSGAFILSF
jgi:hypothetical protein